MLPVVIIAFILTTGLAGNPGDDTGDAVGTANALFDRGAYEEALAWYKRAIVSDPDNIQLQHRITICLCRLNMYAGALESIHRELELNAGNSEATLVLLLEKSMLLSCMNQPEEAKKAFGEYLSLDPKDGSGLLKLILLWKTDIGK